MSEPMEWQNGGDCDVCHRPHMEIKSVVRFWSGAHEFYVCRSCLCAALSVLTPSGDVMEVAVLEGESRGWHDGFKRWRDSGGMRVSTPEEMRTRHAIAVGVRAAAPLLTADLRAENVRLREGLKELLPYAEKIPGDLDTHVRALLAGRDG